MISLRSTEPNAGANLSSCEISNGDLLFEAHENFRKYADIAWAFSIFIDALSVKMKQN